MLWLGQKKFGKRFQKSEKTAFLTNQKKLETQSGSYAYVKYFIRKIQYSKGIGLLIHERNPYGICFIRFSKLWLLEKRCNSLMEKLFSKQTSCISLPSIYTSLGSCGMIFYDIETLRENPVIFTNLYPIQTCYIH